MNLLQSIDEKVHGPVLVTLNPPFEPKKELVAGEWWYDHPLYSEKVSRNRFDQLILAILIDRFALTECSISSIITNDSK